MLKRVQLNTPPCGTPISCWNSSDKLSPTRTRNLLSVWKFSIIRGSSPRKPNLYTYKLSIRWSWPVFEPGTLSTQSLTNFHRKTFCTQKSLCNITNVSLFGMARHLILWMDIWPEYEWFLNGISVWSCSKMKFSKTLFSTLFSRSCFWFRFDFQHFLFHEKFQTSIHSYLWYWYSNYIHTAVNMFWGGFACTTSRSQLVPELTGMLYKQVFLKINIL